MEIKADKNKQVQFDDQKMQEFKDRITNYSTWRWSGVSLYQSIFVVFVTSAILILVDLISRDDWIFKILIIFILILVSLVLYKQMLRQVSKPIFVADNMIATIESKPVTIKGNDGENYSVMNISMIVPNKIKEIKNESNP